jgi:hypothetical protein
MLPPRTGHDGLLLERATEAGEESNMPCCWYPWSVEAPRGRRRWRRAMEDAEEMEDERERLEARLRRLERPLEELRRASPPQP